MPEMFETIKDPAMLAHLDQVCADYFTTTGLRANTLVINGGEYSLCDNLHWHYNGPAFSDEDG